MENSNPPVKKNFIAKYVIVVLFLTIVNVFLYFYSYLPCLDYISENHPNLTLCFVTFTFSFGFSLIIAIPYTTSTMTRFILTRKMVDPFRARTYGRWVGVITLIVLIAGYYFMYK